MEKKKSVYRILFGNLKEGIHLEYAGVVGRIMLKQIIKERDV